MNAKHSTSTRPTWYSYQNLDVPITKLRCGHCRLIVPPSHQIRLERSECGQPTDVIVWDCPSCGRENLTPDDISILDAEVIEL